MGKICYLASKYILVFVWILHFLLRWVHSLYNGNTYIKVVKPQLVEAFFISSNSTLFTKIVIEAISCDIIQSKHTKKCHLTQEATKPGQ